MDITKAKKPIHIQCPYCKKDLQYNGASIKSQKEGLLKRIECLEYKMRYAKTKEQKKKYLDQISDTHEKLRWLAENKHMLSQLSEMEVLKIFKIKARKYLGEEIYIKLCKESEEQYLEDNTFNYYDLAIQKFTNFNGA